MLPRRSDIPGISGSILLALFVGFWTYWSLAEFYYEGWGTPLPQSLAYLIPGAAAVGLAAAMQCLPRVMGAAVILLSVLFYGWAMSMNLRRWGFSWELVLSWTALGGATALAGVLFFFDGVEQARSRASGNESEGPPWWRRLRPYIVFGTPAVIAAIVSAVHGPRLFGRLDDGARGLRLIEENEFRLIWAPQGPGWNWRQSWGGYPAWDDLAFYGVPPIGLKSAREQGARHATMDDMADTGLCGFLDADGERLVDPPSHIWRMPTADEVVRSLTRHGVSAGCVWSGGAGQASCRISPDKETPLWAPDQPPIYMWTGTTRGDEEAWFVNYLGFVSAQPRQFGNPRHGYRCVKEP